MRVGGRFRFGHTRRERRSPWCDESATHPSQKAAKDGAPTVWFAIGRLGPPAFSRSGLQTQNQPDWGIFHPVVFPTRQDRGECLNRQDCDPHFPAARSASATSFLVWSFISDDPAFRPASLARCLD